MSIDNCCHDASAPIGIFDYGAGGLTVVQSIAQVLPNERFVFLADEAKKNHREEEDVARRHKIEDALRYAEFVCRHHVKLLVVGCNLMSVFALEALQQHVDVPVIGLVQPAVTAISERVARPEDKKIAVFTTEMAAYLKLFTRTFEKAFPGIQVFEVGCGSLPKIIDDNLAGTEAADEEVRKYTNQVPDNISAALLTCTRFPILMGSFEKSLPPVPVIDPAKSLAVIVKETLASRDLLAGQPAQSVFYTTGDPLPFAYTAKQLIGKTSFVVERAELL